MEYLEEYNISRQQIKELKEKYNKEIIKFLSNEEIFVKQTLDFLKNKEVLIYPIIENNIRIFLESTVSLKRKFENMEKKGYSKKMIQMILISEELYIKQ